MAADVVKPKVRRARKVFKPGIRLVLGPLPFPVLGQAWRLHAAAPLVLLAIKSEVDIRRWRARQIRDTTGRNAPKNKPIAVTSALCEQLGLGRDSRLRAIRALESAGMITVEWSSRRAPRVRLAAGLFDEGKIWVMQSAGGEPG